MLLLGVVDRSGLISVVVIHISLWKIWFFPAQLVLVIVYFTRVILLNPWGINCLRL